MGADRFSILLSAFRTHIKNGGDGYVPLFLENPVGGEIDVHFGANINSIRQGYRQFSAKIENTQEPGLTSEIIKQFTDAGMVWESTKKDSRGRQKGHQNSIPRGELGKRIYIDCDLRICETESNPIST